MQKVKGTSDDSQAFQELQRVARLILDNMEYSTSMFTDGTKKLELKALMAFYSSVGEFVCGFYRDAEKHLSPDDAQLRIVQRLSEIASEISSVTAKMETLESENEKLASQESELDEKSKKYQERRIRISELKEIEQTVTTDTLLVLENKIKELEATTESNRRTKQELDAKLAEYTKVLESLESSFVKVNSDKAEIEENVIKIINERLATIREICEYHSVDIDKLKFELENYIKQLSQIDTEVERVANSHAAYKAHLGENGAIIGVMQQYQISDINNFVDDVMCHESSVKSELEKYDRIIATLVASTEKAKHEISRRVEISVR